MMVIRKSAGGDPIRGDATAARIGRSLRSTYTPRVLPPSADGATGFFQLDYPRGVLRHGYREPVLVAATAGVGDKLEIAFRMGVAGTVGADVVAFCVNDLVAQGAEPLFFTDHLAAGKLPRRQLIALVEGVAAACRSAGCALLARETVAAPGLYAAGKYELAGFAVGVAEGPRLIVGDQVRPGDRILGLPSSALHGSGYPLVREALRKARWDLSFQPPELDESLGRVLLRPAPVYVKPILALLRSYRRKRVIHAMAPVLRGGLAEAVGGLLRRGTAATIRRRGWEVPPLFSLLQRAGGFSDREMFYAFNMGIGMALVVSRHFAGSIAARLRDLGISAAPIGEIVSARGGPRVRLAR